MNTLKYFAVVIALTVTAFEAQAQRFGGYGGGLGGNHSIGFGLGIMTPSQDDLDSHISNTGVAGVDKFGTAYEFAFNYEYRFDSSIFALQFRPTYFTQSAGGSGYDYDLTGYTFFPILKLYALENEFIHFFLQTGVGYGRLNGKVSTPTGDVEFHGGSFGIMGGLGAAFCFTESHCVTVEGNLRYLGFERNIADSVTGTPGGFSQAVTDRELEFNGSDLKTTMSGIQGLINYQLKF